MAHTTKHEERAHGRTEVKSATAPCSPNNATSEANTRSDITSGKIQIRKEASMRERAERSSPSRSASRIHRSTVGRPAKRPVRKYPPANATKPIALMDSYPFTVAICKTEERTMIVTTWGKVDTLSKMRSNARIDASSCWRCSSFVGSEGAASASASPSMVIPAGDPF